MGNLIEDRGNTWNGIVNTYAVLNSLTRNAKKSFMFITLYILVESCAGSPFSNVECTLWFIPLSSIYLFVSDVMESGDRNEKVTFSLIEHCSEKEKLLSRNTLKCSIKKKLMTKLKNSNFFWKCELRRKFMTNSYSLLRRWLTLFSLTLDLVFKINLFSLKKNYRNRSFCDTCIIAMSYVRSVIALITRKLRI